MSNDVDREFKGSITISLAGEAGQGLNTIETILIYVLKNSFYNVYSTKEYMSRIRGGSNSTTIRVAGKKVRGNIKISDILIPLDPAALEHMNERIDKKSIIIGDDEKIKAGNNIILAGFNKIAKEGGMPAYSNIAIAGFILALFDIEIKTFEDFLKKYFSKKTDDVITKNIFAGLKGYELGKTYRDKIKISIPKSNDVKDSYLLSGIEAVGYGSLDAGCNFISSYPMSPGTGLITFMAQNQKDFEVVVEQAEDEIAAINMGLGAWYAGARAIVTTSGGGFALMSEGLSLAGIIESPMVIHLAERPGPATGLPTRTEQGDLELALYGGHGDFPRVILAPSSLEDAFFLTDKAFYYADKFQMPVFILTDQYFVDTYYTADARDFNLTEEKKFIIETGNDYKRYEFASAGISPRGIPGFGKGVVRVDSDEHDENGFITERADVRIMMTDKRLKKMDSMKKESVDFIFNGSKDYKNLIISWGSTYHTIKEALEIINDASIAHIHFVQVYPVTDKIKKYLSKAEMTVCIENNATGQFAKLLKLETGLDVNKKILKYDGSHFYLEELADELKKIFK